jgi:predicted RNase H-like HicB family nuclease
MKFYEYTIILEYDPEIDEYAALVPALPGCASQGKTREEALQSVQEAIQGHIAALRQLGREIPVEERVRVVTSE